MTNERASLGEATRTGDQLKALIALRDYLADTLDNTTDSRSAASLARQLMDTLSRIEECGGPKKSENRTVLDQLAARRKERGA